MGGVNHGINSSFKIEATIYNWVVISLGGSLIVPDGINTTFISEFKKVILNQVNRGRKFIIVCGGGKTARNYQGACKKLNCESSNNILDLIRIRATNLNALFMAGAFGNVADQRIIKNPDKKILTDRQVIFSGGYKIGRSTDFGAVRFALNIGARLVINLTNIDGVYDKNPNDENCKNVKLIKSILWSDYRAMIPKKWTYGLNSPFDPTASREAEKKDIDVVIINGNNLKNFEHCLNGNRFKGTTIHGFLTPNLYPFKIFKRRRLHNIKDTFIYE
ncbi:MAG: UMP kinase [Patescibacteria group bacterium]|nr:UMP kinase [Patescibacteria group bacterium]MDE1988349.1 UMP kinase [Patescibacteria group bacterium]MDE2218513.1 UMP kinase [Patescibacteria group bacterium]